MQYTARKVLEPLGTGEESGLSSLRPGQSRYENRYLDCASSIVGRLSIRALGLALDALTNAMVTTSTYDLHRRPSHSCSSEYFQFPI